MYTAKQVIVMRRDLKMRKGKIAAQAGHACVEAVLRALTRDQLYPFLQYEDGHISLRKDAPDAPIVHWYRDGEAKICVYVDGEDALLEIDRRLQEAGIISAVICDAGLTEFGGNPTLTCLATEPIDRDLLDPITGALPLY